MPSKKSAGKGSPKKKKSSDKAKKSPGKGKKSPGSKSKKSPKSLEIPPIVLKNVRRKIVWTGYDIKEHHFKNFRCPRCSVVLDKFQAFIDHSCWRKYYSARFHLGCTQAFACRTCELVFYSHSDYASHICFDTKRCDELEFLQPEDVIPIDYDMHHDFYIDWTRRWERETTSHDPDYTYICRCCMCNNKFKTKLQYLLHSCCMFTLLKPAELRRLKTCMHCKYVFLNEVQYNTHVPYCNRKKEFCIEFRITVTEIACQQFVIGRHCYEFDYHLYSGASFRIREDGEPPGMPAMPPPPLKPSLNMEVCCAECGLIQPSLLEFYYHPCVAGKKITPANLELTLFCCDCQCLFPDIEECINHFKACSTTKFIFVRINTPELLRVVLRRWSIEQSENPYLPARQVKFKCDDCNEIYPKFMEFLNHPCPRRERFERLFIQPNGVMETYTCEACHVVLFSVSEAKAHSKLCAKGDHPHMFQVHYSMDEVIAALTPWMRCPQLLQFDLVIGIGKESDELALQELEYRALLKIPQADVIKRFHSKDQKPSDRIEKLILKDVEKKATPAIAQVPRLRNISKEACVRRLKLLNIASLPEYCNVATLIDKPNSFSTLFGENSMYI